MKRTLYMATMGLCVFTATSAIASEGYVTRDVRLRAGPDSGYPTVAMLRGGMEVVIEGCIGDWSWCDVATDEGRGWVAGAFLQNEYRGRHVLIPAYGMQIGIPIVVFELDRYWGSYYRDRPWYGERERWGHDNRQYRPADVRHGYYGNDRTRGDSREAPPANTRPWNEGPSRDVRMARPGEPGVSRDAPASRPFDGAAPPHSGEVGNRPPAAKGSSAGNGDRKTHEDAAPGRSQSRKEEKNRPKGRQDDGKESDQH